MIVRFLSLAGSRNEFKFEPKSAVGTCLKIGRVKFRIRELQLSEDEANTDFNSFVGMQHA